jgi:hypothetical protein
VYTTYLIPSGRELFRNINVYLKITYQGSFEAGLGEAERGLDRGDRMEYCLSVRVFLVNSSLISAYSSPITTPSCSHVYLQLKSAIKRLE